MQDEPARKGLTTAGIDEVTGNQYAENLEENLRSLHERLKSGTYKVLPVRHKHITTRNVVATNNRMMTGNR